MGLDQYAYVCGKIGERDEYYSDENYDKDDNDPTKLSKPRELAYWRKHPNLQGWMGKLWHEKNPGQTSSFNGVELELTWQDIERLESDIKNGTLAELGTTGFFFGNPSDEYYREHDLQFIKDAKAELFLGLKVFYNSSW